MGLCEISEKSGFHFSAFSKLSVMCTVFVTETNNKKEASHSGSDSKAALPCPGATGGYLWHKHQAQRDGAAEDDDQGHNAELHVGLVPGQEGDGGPDDAHDPHVVDAHADVLAVVECWDAHIAGLPS